MVLAILKKELKRVFSDKRLVFSLFILPAISIFVVYSLLGQLSSKMSSNINEHTPVIYIQNSPESFDQFYNLTIDKDAFSVKYVDNNKIDDIKKSIKEGSVDLLVEFENDFDAKISSYKTAATLPEIKTYYNPSEDYSRKSRNQFLAQCLNNYEKDLLTKRFNNINYSKAFAIDSTNSNSIIVDKDKEKGKLLSRILPMLIGILLFASTMSIGIESIAGEKEKGTMANLLLAPINRNYIAYGKMGGLAILSILSAICSFIGIALSVPFSSSFLPVGGGIPSFTAIQLLQLLLIMVTMVGINVGLVCAISVKAKSVKEASTYVAPVYMLVMIASFSSMFGSSGASVVKHAIPIYGSIVSISDILTFNLSTQSFLVTIASSLVTALVLTKVITQSFHSEKTMFNA